MNLNVNEIKEKQSQSISNLQSKSIITSVSTTINYVTGDLENDNLLKKPYFIG